MNGRRSKLLRKWATAAASDNRGLQYVGGTAAHPHLSARAFYQRLKKQFARGGS